MKFTYNLIAIIVLAVTGIVQPGNLSGQEPTENLAGISNDYAKYHLKEGNIPEKWEDGIRTGGIKGTYEWWYFDTHLEDSSTIVIVFYTKSFVKINEGLKPMISIEITRPDGNKVAKVITGKTSDFNASRDSCNVQIGKNYFRGNLIHYEIHCEDADLNLTVDIDRTTNSWRPQTGHLEFGKEKKDYFAWVVPVPKGKANLTLQYKGETKTLSGSCYHDHNWGNRNMVELFNHWYWSRAEIGPFNVIASEMIAEKKFNKKNFIVFNVSRDGKTLVDDGNKVIMYRTYGKMHDKLKKDVSDDLVFIYNDEKEKTRYEYYLYREKFIEESDLLASTINNPLLCSIARILTSFEGAYFRMTGRAEIRVVEKGQLIETYTSDKAVWELMYFGKPNR